MEWRLLPALPLAPCPREPPVSQRQRVLLPRLPHHNKIDLLVVLHLVFVDAAERFLLRGAAGKEVGANWDG